MPLLLKNFYNVRTFPYFSSVNQLYIWLGGSQRILFSVPVYGLPAYDSPKPLVIPHSDPRHMAPPGYCVI